MDMENVELVVQVVEEEAQVYYPQVVNFRDKLELGGTEVYVIAKDKILVRNCSPTPIPTALECEEHLGGLNQIGSRMVILESKTEGCIKHQILAHELLHSVQFFYAIDLSLNHSTPYFFTQNYEKYEDQKETIEYRAEQRLLNSCKYEMD